MPTYFSIVRYTKVIRVGICFYLFDQLTLYLMVFFMLLVIIYVKSKTKYKSYTGNQWLIVANIVVKIKRGWYWEILIMMSNIIMLINSVQMIKLTLSLTGDTNKKKTKIQFDYI